MDPLCATSSFDEDMPSAKARSSSSSSSSSSSAAARSGHNPLAEDAISDELSPTTVRCEAASATAAAAAAAPDDRDDRSRDGDSDGGKEQLSYPYVPPPGFSSGGGGGGGGISPPQWLAAKLEGRNVATSRRPTLAYATPEDDSPGSSAHQTNPKLSMSIPDDDASSSGPSNKTRVASSSNMSASPRTTLHTPGTAKSGLSQLSQFGSSSSFYRGPDDGQLSRVSSGAFSAMPSFSHFLVTDGFTDGLGEPHHHHIHHRHHTGDHAIPAALLHPPVDLTEANSGLVRQNSSRNSQTLESRTVSRRSLRREGLTTPIEVINENFLLYDELLGRGSYSEVRLCHSLRDGEWLAMKIIKRNFLKKLGFGAANAQEKVLREITIMKTLRHDNIIALREVIDDPHDPSIYLILELAEYRELMDLTNDGDLLPPDGDKPYLPEYEVRRVARQVLNALVFAHSHGIAHRDVKPQNILVTAKHEIKLTDFGVSIMVDDSKSTIISREGSIAFLPPELLIPSSVTLSAKSPNLAAAAAGRQPQDSPRMSAGGSGGLAGSSRTSPPSLHDTPGDPMSPLVLTTLVPSVASVLAAGGGGGGSGDPAGSPLSGKDGLFASSRHSTKHKSFYAVEVDLFKADAWSYGVTLFALLIGCLPWKLSKKALKGLGNVPSVTAQQSLIFANPDPFAYLIAAVAEDSQQAKPAHHNPLEASPNDSVDSVTLNRSTATAVPMGSVEFGPSALLSRSAGSRASDDDDGTDDGPDVLTPAQLAAQTPDVAKDFIRWCFTLEPSERPTMAELSDHPWIASSKPLVASSSSTIVSPLSPAPSAMAKWDADSGAAFPAMVSFPPASLEDACPLSSPATVSTSGFVDPPNTSIRSDPSIAQQDPAAPMSTFGDIANAITRQRRTQPVAASGTVRIPELPTWVSTMLRKRSAAVNAKFASTSSSSLRAATRLLSMSSESPTSGGSFAIPASALFSFVAGPAGSPGSSATSLSPTSPRQAFQATPLAASGHTSESLLPVGHTQHRDPSAPLPSSSWSARMGFGFATPPPSACVSSMPLFAAFSAAATAADAAVAAHNDPPMPGGGSKPQQRHSSQQRYSLDDFVIHTAPSEEPALEDSGTSPYGRAPTRRAIRRRVLGKMAKDGAATTKLSKAVSTSALADLSSLESPTK